MRVFNLATDSLGGLTKVVRSITADWSGANGPAVSENAKILARSVRKVLGVSGGGRLVVRLASRRASTLGAARSKPGEPPRRQTGSLAKSVKTGVVGSGQRVAVTSFEGMLEEGVDTARQPRANRRGRVRARRGRFAGGRNRLVIAPRPFMQRALDAVVDEMVGVTVRIGEDAAAKAGG